MTNPSMSQILSHHSLVLTAGREMDEREAEGSEDEIPHLQKVFHISLLGPAPQNLPNEYIDRMEQRPSASISKRIATQNDRKSE